jgi:ribose transport system permease protein
MQLELRMLGLLVVLGLILSFVSPYFLTMNNIANVMDQSVVTGIVAIGQTFVILTAGIDLSVGSLVGVTGIAFGLANQSSGLAPGIAACLFSGALLGWFNGIVIVRGRVAPFVVTLGMLSIGRSLSYILSGANSIADVPQELSDFVGFVIFKFLPLNFVILLFFYAAAWAYLAFTKGGRTIYAIGSNIEAARIAGLRVGRYNVLVYTISGCLSAVAAIFLSGRILSIDPIAGTGLELDTIAAVVIGGTSLFGGRGSVIGTLIGVFIMVLIRNGLNLLNVSPYWQGTAIGSIIIIAVLVERLMNARAMARRAKT